MAGKMADSLDIRNALASIYHHFQTLDKAHLFDAVIADAKSSSPALASTSSAHVTPSSLQHVTKIPCGTSSEAPVSLTSTGIQTEPFTDPKVLDRLNTAEETSTALRAEFLHFKTEVLGRLESLEKTVQELQGSLGVGGSNNSSSSGISSSNSNSVSNNNSNNDDTNSSGNSHSNGSDITINSGSRKSSVNVDENGSNKGASNGSNNDDQDDSNGNNSNSNDNKNGDYTKLSDASFYKTSAIISSSGGSTNPVGNDPERSSDPVDSNTKPVSTINTDTMKSFKSVSEHIYEEPSDFEDGIDSMPRYRAPPPPSLTLSASQPPVPSQPLIIGGNSQTQLQQQQPQHNKQQQQINRQPYRSQGAPRPTSEAIQTTATPSPQPSGTPRTHAQPPLHITAAAVLPPQPSPRAPPVSPGGEAPSPPTSIPPPRPPPGNTSGDAAGSGSTSNPESHRDGSGVAQHASVSRSPSAPSPSHPPPVRPRTKPRLNSVGAPGLHHHNTTDSPQLSVRPEAHHHQTEHDNGAAVDMREGRGRPHSEGPDTLLIRPHTFSIPDPVGQQPRSTGTAAQSASAPSPKTEADRTARAEEQRVSSSSAPGATPLSIGSRPPTPVHSMLFNIESISRFKSAVKLLPIHPLCLELDCCLKLHSKDKLSLTLSPSASSSTSPGIKPAPSSGKPKKPQLPQTLQPSVPSPGGSLTSLSPSIRAHVSIIQAAKDVSDDKILDEGWVVNLYQPCCVVLNPRELFKTKGKVTILLEVKLDDPRHSHC